MARQLNGRPGDEQGFIHKKLLGGISAITGVLPIPGAGIVSTVTRALAGSGKTVPRTLTARPTAFSAAEKDLGRQLKFGGTGGNGDGCIWPTRRDPSTGTCRVFLGERAGPNGGAPIGEAVMGQFGAALQPGIMTIDRAVCLPGMQLGKDGLCYNKAQISNKQRMWPAGRKPLLSGGDMRAISIAARAGRRMELATKRLQKLGMMKRPAQRGSPRGSTRKPTVIKEAGAGSVTVQ